MDGSYERPGPAHLQPVVGGLPSRDVTGRDCGYYRQMRLVVVVRNGVPGTHRVKPNFSLSFLGVIEFSLEIKGRRLSRGLWFPAPGLGFPVNHRSLILRFRRVRRRAVS